MPFQNTVWESIKIFKKTENCFNYYLMNYCMLLLWWCFVCLWGFVVLLCLVCFMWRLLCVFWDFVCLFVFLASKLPGLFLPF